MFQAPSVPRLRHARAVSPSSAAPSKPKETKEWSIPATVPVRRRTRKESPERQVQLGGLSVVAASTQTTPSLLRQNEIVKQSSFKESPLFTLHSLSAKHISTPVESPTLRSSIMTSPLARLNGQQPVVARDADFNLEQPVINVNLEQPVGIEEVLPQPPPPNLKPSFRKPEESFRNSPPSTRAPSPASSSQGKPILTRPPSGLIIRRPPSRPPSGPISRPPSGPISRPVSRAPSSVSPSPRVVSPRVVSPRVVSPSPLVVSPSPRVVSPSPSPSFASPSSPSGPESPRAIGAQLAVWEKWMRDMFGVIEHQDCRVPHEFLVKLQNDILDALQANQVKPKFMLQSVMANARPPKLNLPGGGGEERITYTKNEVTQISRQLRNIGDVLMEPYIAFFQREQHRRGGDLDPNQPPVVRVEKFLQGIQGGPYSGRSPVGQPCQDVPDFPAVIFATGPVDEQHKRRLKIPPGAGPGKWTTLSDCICPLRVLVVLEEVGSGIKQRSQATNNLLAKAAEVLARLTSDWHCHRLRVFYWSSHRYQSFLPTVSKLTSAELAKAGWSEMIFNGTNVVRWKTIEGGLILSYLAGIAEASVDKTLALVYDGDNHKNWIPFLTETKRLFSMSPMAFAFGYGVSLPWPLNRRELSILGMATDSLTIAPMNAVQMWGGNVPEIATSCFGVPLEKPKGSTVVMEMPVLSFSLTPVSSSETFVRMAAVIDVKINFLPMALQNYMAKHMATKMFGNVQRICKTFDKTTYRQVVDENRELFERMMKNVPEATEAQQRQMRGPH